MRKMKLSDIRITSAFTESTPTESKMQECREHWDKFQRQDRYIVVDHDNTLIDGYIQYLILKENNIEEAEIKIWHCKKKRWYRKNVEGWKTPKYRTEPTTYIFGVHPNSNCIKEFCWRVPTSWGNWADNIELGDTILCQTKYGFSPVVVNRVEILDKPPIEMRIKKVARKEIRRNGMVVE